MPRKKPEGPEMPEETVIDPPQGQQPKSHKRQARGLDDDFTQPELRRKFAIGLNGLSRVLGSGQEHAEGDFKEAAEAMEDIVNHLPWPAKPIIRVVFSIFAILDVAGKIVTTVQLRQHFRPSPRGQGQVIDHEAPTEGSPNGGFRSPFGGFGVPRT